MDLFDRLQEQIDTVRLPLLAVTVTAAAQVNAPLIAILHWHGFRRSTPLVLRGIEIPPRPVPGSAVRLDAPWHSFETVDAMLLDAAWQSGAWEVERVEQRSCNVIGASAAEALACRQAFGDYGEGGAPGQPLLDDETDRGELMQLAARRGYVRWLFRPVKGGLWRTLNEPDDTLDADGGRQPPCPVLPKPRLPDGRGRTVIASARPIASRRRAETNCYKGPFSRPLEGRNGRHYFAFRQTLARLHCGALRAPVSVAGFPYW